MLLLTLPFLFTSCEKDIETEEQLQAKGSASFEITDAPIDDTNIKGSFVTVTAIKVDGEVLSNFSGKQTIDLMAYQNGNVKGLGTGELQSGTYSNISLVLDYEKDVDGNAPGCYVLTKDNVKHDLKSTANSSNEIQLNSKSFTIEEDKNTKIVLDFDVRKAVKKQDAPEEDDRYDFVTTAELKASIRLVDKDNCGTVNGNASDMLGVAGDRIVVYAYQKGTFSKDTETSGQGNSNIMFKNAVSSAIVTENGDYNLSFLSEGEYELHYVGYEDENNDGQMNVRGMLTVSALTSLDLLGFKINATADVAVNVSVIGITPL